MSVDVADIHYADDDAKRWFIHLSDIVFLRSCDLILLLLLICTPLPTYINIVSVLVNVLQLTLMVFQN